MTKHKRGFTMTEILIVVVIIGILASLVIPRFTGQTEHARVAEAVNFLGAMRRAELRWFDENSRYTTLTNNCLRQAADDWTPAGLQRPFCPGNTWSYRGISAQETITDVPNGGRTIAVPAGSVIATRAQITTNIPNIVGEMIILFPQPQAAAGGGTTMWEGTGAYAPGQAYAPRQ